MEEIKTKCEMLLGLLEKRSTTFKGVVAIREQVIQIAQEVDKIEGNSVVSTILQESILQSDESRYERRKVKRALKFLLNYVS